MSTELPAADSARGRSGTWVMVAGMVTSAIGAYGFQVLGGRLLGPEAFAPVTVLWTLFFLGFTILLMPVEQLVIRRLTLAGGHRHGLTGSWRSIALIGALSIVAGTLFVVVALDRFFEGDSMWIPATFVLFSGYVVYAVGRGFLASRRRFRAYGTAVIGEALGRIVLALILWSILGGAGAFGWGLALAPIVIFALRPFREDGSETVEPPKQKASGRFLTGLVVGTAASQIVLAGGPIFAGLLGAAPEAVSIFFVTFTLFRGPITAFYNLVSRVLPEFVRLVSEGRSDALRKWSTRLLSSGLVLAICGGAIGWYVGPAIVGFLYGADFEPEPLLAALAVGGAGAGLVVLLVTQILIAEGAMRRFAFLWLLALGLAALVVLVVDASPSIRVGWGFAVGEVAALVLLATVGVRGRVDPGRTPAPLEDGLALP